MRISWVERSSAAPSTDQWMMWLAEAEAVALDGRRDWPAVAGKNALMNIVASSATADATADAAPGLSDSAAQHAPLMEVQGLQRKPVAPTSAL